MFIAIEGVDGVGKTTVARLLAEQLQCEFVESPFTYCWIRCQWKMRTA